MSGYAPFVAAATRDKVVVDLLSENERLEERIERLRTPFHLTIQTLTGRQFQVEVRLLNTVGDLKRKIQDQEGILPHQQHLIFEGAGAHRQ